MGTLTRRRGSDWLVAVSRAHELQPGAYVLVPSPSGREAVVQLSWRVGASLRFDEELWDFEIILTRNQGAAAYDGDAHRALWAREVERLWRVTPMRVVDLIVTRKRRRQRTRPRASVETPEAKPP